MRLNSIVACVALLGILPMHSALAQSDEEQFQEMVAYLQANDSEREAAIATCIDEGIGDNPTGVAKVLGVPVEEATTVWCTRTTNGIAAGKLTLADMLALDQGTLTPNMEKVLTAAPESD
jgi:hypothetical protein